MTRLTISLAVLAASAVWVFARPGVKNRVDPVVQHKMLKRNRDLVGEVIDRGLDVAEADGPLKRAEADAQLMGSLRGEIDRAGESDDTGRVRELAGHLDTLTRRSATPAVADARRAVSPGSQGEAELYGLRDDMVGHLRAAESTLRGLSKSPESLKLLSRVRSAADGIKIAARPHRDGRAGE